MDLPNLPNKIEAKVESFKNASQVQTPQDFREGPVARAIETQTAKIPSDVFLWAAGGAMALSLVSHLRQPKRMTFFSIPSRQGQLGLFFGQWVPTILMLGLYNKMVKTAGASDAATAQRQPQNRANASRI